MIDQLSDAATSAARALAWMRARGIAVRRWPDDRPSAADGGTLVHQPTLWVVGLDVDPPAREDLTDWIREPLDPTELRWRADGLLARAGETGPIYLSLEDGVLHVDGSIVILSVLEAAILEVLVAHLGSVVARGDLAGRVWGDPEAPLRLLNRHVSSLRKRLEGLPLAIHAVRGRGLLLERVPREG